MEIPALKLKNFLKATDCYLFEIVESAGASAPYVIVSIKTSDQRVLNGINENNKIILKVGNSESEADSFDVYPVVIDPNNSPMNGQWTISFGGFIANKRYMVDCETMAYEGTSLDVIKEVLKSNFSGKLVTDIKSVGDNKIVWRRVAEPCSNFAMKTVLHMNLYPSFPLCAVNRYSQFILKDFDSLCKKDPKYYLVQSPASQPNELQMMNNFNVSSFKNSYNMFAGYNKVSDVLNSVTGEKETLVDKNKPVIASSKVSEKYDSGITKNFTEIQNDNVHDTYSAMYRFNSNKLISLSSIAGEVVLAGYQKNLTLLDLVYVKDEVNSDSCIGGLYLVDNIVTAVNFSSGLVITTVHITKDNKNNIENYIEQKKRIKVRQDLLKALAKAVGDLRTAYAVCLNIIDGTYLKELLNFALSAKNNILRMFSIADVSIDFTGQTSILTNLVLVGNSLMNTLVDMLFPRDIASILENFLIYKPTLKNMVLSYIVEYVPSELQDIMIALVDALTKTTDTLNSIAKDNDVDVTKNPRVGEGAELATNVQTIELDPADQKVSDIISIFEERTQGVDIPFPVVSLTDHQQLMSDSEITDYLAEETIRNLTNLGYIKTEGDKKDLKDVLLGNSEISFSLIDRINSNVGKLTKYRYWGTFGSVKEALYAWRYEDHVVYTKIETLADKKPRLYNDDYSPYANIEFKPVEVNGVYTIEYMGHPAERDEELDVLTNALAELTSFEIKKGYKDTYKNIPCTKIVNATENQRIYFACPKSEHELIFRINVKKVNLPYFEVDLGYVDPYGVPILYNVYYTETGYNSNSVLFEVKKGGTI